MATTSRPLTVAARPPTARREPIPSCQTLADPNHRLGNYQVTLVNGTLTVTPPPVLTPPVIQAAKQSGGSFTFTWSATAKQTYQIESATNLTNAKWATFGGLITATNSTMTTSEAIATNSPQFYRVVLLP